MADITMCQNHLCAMRNNCYRFTATPTPLRQSYAVFIPKYGQCDGWIEAKSKSQVRRLDAQTKKEDTDTGNYYDNFVDGNGY